MLPIAAAVALAVFVGAFALFVVEERHRLLVAAGGAAILLATGIVPLGSLRPSGFGAVGSVIEWNSLGLLAGLFLFAGLLAEVGLLRWAALRIAGRAHGRPLALLLALSALSFALSAFVNSLTVVLVLASVTLEIARTLRRDPIPFLLAEISSANAGGAATFIGDLPNVVFGTYFHLSFLGFLLHTGVPALAALAVILALFTRGLGRPDAAAAPPAPAPSAPLPPGPRTPIALAGFVGLLVTLAAQGPLGVPVWLVGVGAGLVALAIAGPTLFRAVLRRLDLETIGFFLFLFVLVGGLETTGLIAAGASGLAGLSRGDLLLTGSLLLWGLGLLSAFVDNVPVAAAAAPLVAHLAGDAGLAATPLVYAASLGTDLGGNGTPIGASANVIGLGLARRAGVAIDWRLYLRRAFPAMLASLAAANLVWLVLR